MFGATKEDNKNSKPYERLVLNNARGVSGRLSESTLYAIINKSQGGDAPSLRCAVESVDGGEVMIGRRSYKMYLLPPPRLSEVSSSRTL